MFFAIIFLLSNVFHHLHYIVAKKIFWVIICRWYRTILKKGKNCVASTDELMLTSTNFSYILIKTDIIDILGGKLMNENHRYIISLIIENERKRRAIYDQNFIMKNFVAGICSVKTYHSLIQQKRKSKEMIYVNLLDKLGYSYQLFPCIDENMSALISKFYQAITSLNKQELNTVYGICQTIFDEAKGYVYYREFFEIISSIYNFFYLGLREYEETIELLYPAIQNPKLNELVSYLLYENYRYSDCVTANCYLVKNNNDISFLQAVYAFILKDEQPLKNLETTSLNVIQETMVNVFLDKPNSGIDYIVEGQMIYFARSHLYYYLGYYAVTKNEYQNAVDYFIEYLEISKDTVEYCIVACIVNEIVKKQLIRVDLDAIVRRFNQFKANVIDAREEEKDIVRVLFYLYTINEAIYQEEVVSVLNHFEHDGIDLLLTNINENKMN